MLLRPCVCVLLACFAIFFLKGTMFLVLLLFTLKKATLLCPRRMMSPRATIVWRRAFLVCCGSLAIFSLWMSVQHQTDEETIAIADRANITQDVKYNNINKKSSSSSGGSAAGTCNEVKLGRQQPANMQPRTRRRNSGSTAPPDPSNSSSEVEVLPLFNQILTYVGPVELRLLDSALSSLFKHFVPSTKSGIVLYAVDGTLLNLLRWGFVLNDNDLDIGFHVVGVPLNNTMEHYYTLLRALAMHELISPVSQRELDKLHSSTGKVKRGKCKHRGQLMQCVLLVTGVMVDFFGPETIFSKLSGLRVDDVEPPSHCRSFSSEFPCPAQHGKYSSSSH